MKHYVASRLRRIKKDLQARRNIEAYVLFVVGIVVSIVSVFQVGSTYIALNAILVGVTFLVFHSTFRNVNDLEGVLAGRDSFGPLPNLLKDAKDLRVYAPTALNVLANAADIRQHILERGGSVKIVVQDPQAAALEITVAQLDDNADFRQTLASSISSLMRLSKHSTSMQYRLLAFNPGFSLIVVNAESHDGYVIVEFHGFQDENIADRMHVTITKSDSPRWFSYWSGRFDAIWGEARTPEVTTL